MVNRTLIAACVLLSMLLCPSKSSAVYWTEQINELSQFGYDQTSYLGEHGNKRFYSVPSKVPERLNVAVLHSDLNDNDYLVDLDPLLTRNSRGKYVLSYIIMPHEINTFNSVLSTKLRAANPAALTVRVFHHLAGKSPGQLYERWSKTFVESPVFTHSYNWHAEKQEWRPGYEQKTKKNISGIGRFNEGTRYSLNSTKDYVEYLNKVEEERTPSLRFTETPREELDRALKDGTEALRERHKKYELWSDGYWAFHNIPMAHSVINGDFELVEINRDFRYLFVNFLRAYGETCQTFMKNPKELTYILSEREIDAHGFTVSEDTTKVSVILEAGYVETYDAYWNNSGDRAAVLGAVFQSFSRQNKNPGYSSELFRSADYLNAARTMLYVDTCDEPAPQRLLINLLKRVTSQDALKSDIKLVANDNSTFTEKKVMVSGMPQSRAPNTSINSYQDAEQLNFILEGLKQIELRHKKEIKLLGETVNKAFRDGASESEQRLLMEEYQNKVKDLQKSVEKEVQAFLLEHQ